MHKTSTVPLLSKVHRAEFCTDRIFSHFLQSNMFPGYIHGFTFGIKLVYYFFEGHMGEDQNKVSESLSVEVFHNYDLEKGGV